MRIKTLRRLVIFSVIIISIIIFIQLFWLNKVYSLEQKIFNTNVVKSIRGVYEDLPLVSETHHTNLQKLIEHPSPEYFLFRHDTTPDPKALFNAIKQELLDFDVMTDVHTGIYDPTVNRYHQEQFLSTVAPLYKKVDYPAIKVFKRPYGYIALYFPRRDRYVLSQMEFWIISSIALIIALGGLAISLIYFYRQKFLAEVQKDFVNNFTHEFKTPLAVMKIASGVLNEPDIAARPEKLKNYASILEKQTTHLQQQVEKLLTLATNNSQKLTYDMKMISLNHLIEESVAQLQPLADSRKARITLKLDDRDPKLYADAGHLSIAIVNIIENALKYAEEPRVLIQTLHENGNVLLSIKDNGIGIEPKYLKRIFQKFYRVPTGNIHNVKGFGLGLNFSRQIITEHDGKIQVSSIPGIGTEFKISFHEINLHEKNKNFIGRR